MRRKTQSLIAEFYGAKSVNDLQTAGLPFAKVALKYHKSAEGKFRRMSMAIKDSKLRGLYKMTVTSL